MLSEDLIIICIVVVPNMSILYKYREFLDEHLEFVNYIKQTVVVSVFSWLHCYCMTHRKTHDLLQIYIVGSSYM